MTTRHACWLVLSLVAGVLGADWPGFRGPLGTGTSDEHGLPIRWGPKEGVAWKTRLPGPGASSPIVCGDRVFVTCWNGYGDGKESDDMEKLRRHVVCLDRASGRILWKSDTPAKLPELPWGQQITQHGYTTSTPVTDGERVYAYFGRSGVVAYDLEGKELWRKDVGDYRNQFGSGASPIVFRDLLIVNATIECGRMLALDRRTGAERWRVRINGDCWTTPILVAVPGGATELVLFAPATLIGFDPETGKELWQSDCPEPDYVSSSPVARDGIVYLMGAGNNGRLCMAVRAGGRGDVSKTHVLWRQQVGASYCSPVLAGDYLFFFSTLAHCLRASTGEVLFQERLPGLGREYASPVAADGKVYLFTRRGNGLVLAAQAPMKLLANNDLGDSSDFIASPAISRGQLFVRSHEYLYAIGTAR